MLQVEAQFGPPIELCLPAREICLPETDPAPNVISNQEWIDNVFRYHRCSHRISAPRMKVWQPDNLANSFQFRSRTELSQRFAFDPILWRCDQAHRGMVNCVHGKCFDAPWR